MTGNLHIEVPGCTTCPVLSCCCCCCCCCFCFCCSCCCSKNIPADEPGPFTIIPDGESGKQLHYIHAACAASDSVTINDLAVDPFLILLSGTLQYPFLFVKNLVCFHAMNEIKNSNLLLTGGSKISRLFRICALLFFFSIAVFLL